MQTGFYISGVAGTSITRQMDILSQNIANANTVGYRADRGSFAAYFAKSSQQASQSNDAAVFPDSGRQYIDVSEAAMSQTGNELDLGLNGNAYFRIQLKDGGEAYTRAGNFQKNANGDLVTVDGKNVLDDAGSPINLPAGKFTVSEGGDMSVNGASVGRIGVVQILDPHLLQKKAGVLLTTPAENVKPSDNKARVMQGYIERSNVNAVQSMTELIAVQRRFQSLMKIIADYDRQMGQLTQQVGRVPQGG